MVLHLQVVSLRKQLAEVQRQLAAKQKLLKVADPDGYFAPGLDCRCVLMAFAQ
jgi:hypothetical protein